MVSSSSDSFSKPGLSVAIIGNGIAGAAAARQLSLTMPEQLDRITLYEIGRGPGGRASTRKTRAIPALGINHGAPYADITTSEGLELLSSLGDGITPYTGVRCVLDGNTGACQRRERLAGEALITGINGEMAAIAGALMLDDHNARLPRINSAYSTMIRGLSRSDGEEAPWILRDKNAEEVGRADWLVVAGSGVAHPRWSDTFGGEPPLVAVASQLADAQLNEALAVIAGQTAAPVLTVLMHCTGNEAEQWQRLGFNDGRVEHHSVLAKISIQPCGPESCSVVLHSTIDYARGNAGVYGASSSAARVGDASSDSAREEAIVDEMLTALGDIPGMPVIEKSRYGLGPLLHRWGNAFPEGQPLPGALSLCPTSRVAFCGDYTSTSARMGSCECALLSGTHAADAIRAQAMGDV
ncbi:NAD(P)-binding protein [Halomonas sp. BLK-85]